jgi:uncharacterized delta-60 repeat protein
MHMLIRAIGLFCVSLFVTCLLSSVPIARSAPTTTLWVLDQSYATDGVLRVNPVPVLNNYQPFFLPEERLMIGVEGRTTGRGDFEQEFVLDIQPSGTISASVYLFQTMEQLNLRGVQSDGKLLLLENSGLQRRDFSLVVDPSFTTIPTDVLPLGRCCLVVDEDDSLLVGPNATGFIRRFSANGVIDTTFAQNVGPFGFVQSIVAHPNGTFLVQSDETVLLECSATLYSQQGTLLTSLYTDTGSRPGNFCNTTGSFLPHPNGSFFWMQADVGVYRSLADGTFDGTFGTNGKAALPLPMGWSFYRTALALQNDGKLLVAGVFNTPYGKQTAIVRLTTTGQPDSSFGTNGLVQVGTSFQSLGAVHVQADGKILLIGDQGEDLVIARLQETPITTRLYLPQMIR